MLNTLFRYRPDIPKSPYQEVVLIGEHRAPFDELALLAALPVDGFWPGEFALPEDLTMDVMIRYQPDLTAALMPTERPATDKRTVQELIQEFQAWRERQDARRPEEGEMTDTELLDAVILTRDWMDNLIRHVGLPKALDLMPNNYGGRQTIGAVIVDLRKRITEE